MGKQFKGKTCAYCAAVGASQTGDHIFAREFFSLDQRANLPQVPACSRCNNDKSALEHYLTAVMPFGGRQPGSANLLNEMVPKRLARNRKLHLELAAGLSQVMSDEGGVMVPTSALPFQSEKLFELVRLIVRGLTVYHWQTQVPSNYTVGAGSLTRYGEGFVAPLLAKNGQARVVKSWGGGIFEYEGVQGVGSPALTVWRFSAYGRLKLGGDPDMPDEMVSDIWAITAAEAFPGLYYG